MIEECRQAHGLAGADTLSQLSEGGRPHGEQGRMRRAAGCETVGQRDHRSGLAPPQRSAPRRSQASRFDGSSSSADRSSSQAASPFRWRRSALAWSASASERSLSVSAAASARVDASYASASCAPAPSAK